MGKALLSLLFATLAVAQDAPVLSPAIAAAVAAIDGFDYGEFAYGRYADGLSTGPTGAALAGHSAWTRLVAAPVLPRADLEALLAHPEPKVRTLAMLLLFDREEFDVLPRLATLLDDPAVTIPRRSIVPEAKLAGDTSPPRYQVTAASVGDVAAGLLGFYYGVLDYRGPHDDAGFAAFWRPRRGRATTIGWLRVRLMRATGGMSPIRAECRDRVGRVRAAVAALASPDRELARLGALAPWVEAGDAFATEAERIAAALALGDDGLLACLAGNFPSDDPDLALLFCRGGVPGDGSTLHRFVLDPDHAIFTPAAAPRLLALEREQRRAGRIDAGWIAVAASLRPEHAGEWVGDALARLDANYDGMQTAELLRVLVRCGGAAAEPAVVARFWQEDLVRLYGVAPRRRVLAALAARPHDDALRLLRALVAAPTFAGADAGTMLAVHEAARVVLGRTVLDDYAIRAGWHPLGLGNLVTSAQRQAARAQYPADSERLDATVARWRAALELAIADG